MPLSWLRFAEKAYGRHTWPFHPMFGDKYTPDMWLLDSLGKLSDDLASAPAEPYDDILDQPFKLFVPKWEGEVMSWDAARTKSWAARRNVGRSGGAVA